MSSASRSSRTIENALRRNGASYFSTSRAKIDGWRSEAANAASSVSASSSSPERYPLMPTLYIICGAFYNRGPAALVSAVCITPPLYICASLYLQGEKQEKGSRSLFGAWLGFCSARRHHDRHCRDRMACERIARVAGRYIRDDQSLGILRLLHPQQMAPTRIRGDHHRPHRSFDRLMVGLWHAGSRLGFALEARDRRGDT